MQVASGVRADHVPTWVPSGPVRGRASSAIAKFAGDNDVVSCDGVFRIRGGYETKRNQVQLVPAFAQVAGRLRGRRANEQGSSRPSADSPNHCRSEQVSGLSAQTTKWRANLSTSKSQIAKTHNA